MTEAVTQSVPLHYQDPSQLKNLLANKTISDEAKLKEAAIQFESIMLRQVLKDSLKPLFKGYLDEGEGGSGKKIYRSMVVDKLADSISRTGAIGMANSLHADLMKQHSASVSPSQAKPKAGSE